MRDQRPRHNPPAAPPRRALLGAGLGLAGAGLLAACSPGSSPAGGHSGHGSAPSPSPADPRAGANAGAGWVDPAGPEVRAAEAARKAGPAARELRLTATPTTIDLGAGRTVRTWAYGDRLPGAEVRVTAGSTLSLTLANHLPAATSLHWHGLALRNDMDGVPGLTQRDVAPGASFAYSFAVPHPGTYWFHPHSGTQQDRGLYAPLIVEDPREPLSYDREWVVVLDDWVDGVEGSTPESVLAELRGGMGGDGTGGGAGDGGGGHTGHGGRAPLRAPGTAPAPAPSPAPSRSGPSRMAMGTRSDVLGADAGDVAYPFHLVNGRVPEDPSVFEARPGDRIRLRIVNAGGDTAYRLALGGHELTVTHSDGFPVVPVKARSLLLGMGERYDVVVTAGDGVFPLTAVAEGKGRAGLALLRTGSGGGGARPTEATRPAELSGAPWTAAGLRPAESVALARRAPDRTVRIRLTGGMARYDWAFDGQPYRPDRRHGVVAGERVRVEFNNSTTMWHPLHLHGHTFALAGGAGGARKDTAPVLPGQTLTAEFDADNPGLWMVHCHNVYHAEAGMMTVLGYRA
ncbi:multicopper oxidase family protein [Streptomyces sp. BI20]|uniref:multicopper oxidase family protein n=1 Tax=Streptomyces sp. BI20 TaxID=3403460 RepID=UPI003C795586